ncbi:unnamed protein product, partial [Ectocarpus sp. 8 AP-2014]
CTVPCLLLLLLRARVVCRRQSFLFSAMLSSIGVFFVVLASVSTGGLWLAADRSVKCIRSSVERPYQLLACGARGVDAGLSRRTDLFDAEWKAKSQMGQTAMHPRRSDEALAVCHLLSVANPPPAKLDR